MNKLNKNRILGGSVLALAAFLFAPALLTPQPHSLTQPSLAVSMQQQPTPPIIAPTIQHTPTTVVATSPEQTSIATVDHIPAPPKLELTAQDTTPEVQTNTNRRLPVSLESTRRTIQPQTRQIWLRVASFNNRDNANKLVNDLQATFPASINAATVNNKQFYRVLVGPFSDPAKIAIAKKVLATKGHASTEQK